MLEVASKKEIQKWDELICSNNYGSNPLQTKSFMEIKSKFGWLPLFLKFGYKDEKYYFCLIRRKIKFLGELWYLPKAPAFSNDEEGQKVLESFLEHINKLAKKYSVFMLKIESEIEKSDAVDDIFKKHNSVKVPNLQVGTSTIIIDVDKDKEHLSKSFSQRGRRGVRMAIKNNVKAREVEITDRNLEKMYELMTHSYGGQGIPGMRQHDYYKAFWKAFDKFNKGALYFAFDDHNEVLAGAFICYIGENAIYKDGGSMGNSARHYAPYALQWEIMCSLHNKGVKNYDLYGSPPEKDLKNKNHKYYGLGIFKTAFSKNVTEFCSCYDIIIGSKLKYKFWVKVVERVIRRLNKGTIY